MSTNTHEYAPGIPDAEILPREHEISADLGITVRKLAPTWETLTEELVCVDIRIGHWGGASVLQAQDLGLHGAGGEFQRFALEFLRFGKKLLTPAEHPNRLRSIGMGARQLISQYGIANPFGRGRLVPLRAMAKLKAELESRQTEYFKAGYAWSDTRDSWAPEVVCQYRKLARQAYLASRGLPQDTDVPESVIAEFTHAIQQAIPSADSIRQSLCFSWSACYLEPPKVLGEGLNVAKLESRIEKLKADLANIPVETARKAAEQELEAHREKLAIETELFAETAKAAEEMRREELLGVLGAFQSQIRACLLDMANTARESIRSRASEGKPVHQRTLAGIRHSVEILRSLNWEGDEGIERMAQEVAELASVPSPKANTQELLAVLDDIRIVVAAECFRDGSQDRLEGLDIAPPSPEQESIARERFGLPATGEAIPSLIPVLTFESNGRGGEEL